MANHNTPTLTWDTIPSAGPADIQSGRNVYIELNEDRTCTKASAGKILQFIKEGFMPVLKVETPAFGSAFLSFATSEFTSGIVMYVLSVGSNSPLTFYAYSDALDKPFTTIRRDSEAPQQ